MRVMRQFVRHDDGDLLVAPVVHEFRRHEDAPSTRRSPATSAVVVADASRPAARRWRQSAPCTCRASTPESFDQRRPLHGTGAGHAGEERRRPLQRRRQHRRDEQAGHQPPRRRRHLHRQTDADGRHQRGGPRHHGGVRLRRQHASQSGGLRVWRPDGLEPRKQHGRQHRQFPEQHDRTDEQRQFDRRRQQRRQALSRSGGPHQPADAPAGVQARTASINPPDTSPARRARRWYRW